MSGAAEGARVSSLPAQLARAGVVDGDAALGRLRGLTGAGEDAVPGEGDAAAGEIIELVALTADPDAALLGLSRLVEAGETELGSLLRGLGGPAVDPVGEAAAADLRRLVRVLGASVALTNHCVRHRGRWRLAAGDGLAVGAAERRETLLAAVARALELAAAGEATASARQGTASGRDVAAGARDGTATTARDGAAQRDHARDALKVAYRDQLLAIAASDLAAPSASAALPAVGAALADLADAALAAALAIATAEARGAGDVRLAVIALGKTGARELNYVSDVDVLYVAEPREGSTLAAGEAAAVASRVAGVLGQVCGGVTAEGSLWEVDAALRPEGRNGPLARSLASHVAYYERWAEPWEFQAMLKARVAAGDADLGARWLAAIQPLVWRAAEREGFVDAARAMRRRVVDQLPAREADRQLKLGRGGLRDVEFSVQLLQLVHGRTDPRVRSPTTLVALEALTTHGYVGRTDGAELDTAYRFLRVLEHRLQLHRMARSHVLPSGGSALRRLARLVLGRGADADDLERRFAETGRLVAHLHEKLFYRPLLSSVARLSTDEVHLAPEAARARLEALGYADPAGALRHIEALTSGVSRRATIQRTLLPALLGMFADAADPDAGLLEFRRISDSLGSSPWYLKMLRDAAGAAERFAVVLASGHLLPGLIHRAPNTTVLVESDEHLVPPAPAGLFAEGKAVADRWPAAADAVRALRAIHGREVVRTGIADVSGLLDPGGVSRALSASAALTTDVAVRVCARDWLRERGRQAVGVEGALDALPTRLLVVGLGRLAGREMSYGSDIDVVVVHDPRPGVDLTEATEAARDVVARARSLLRAPGAEPVIELDPGLRPEGRAGELVRSLDAVAAYYARWSSPWEHQALIRARPLIGEAELAARFAEVVDPLRYPPGGPGEPAVAEIRRIKARVEAERLPRGVDPRRHVKLGRGGLADVEWTVQLLQLRHAAEHEELRTPSTLGALAAAAEAGLVAGQDAALLSAAWRLASRLRDAMMLWRGRSLDALPTGRRDLDGLARLCGYPAGAASRLEDDWLRVARQARGVVERVFYGWE